MVAVGAFSNGRRITLDPIREYPVEIVLREVESTIPCGFRMGWIDGEVESGPGKGTKFDLYAGAGCGSPWLTFSYGGRDFCVDMRTVVEQFIEAVASDDG